MLLVDGDDHALKLQAAIELRNPALINTQLTVSVSIKISDIVGRMNCSG